MDTSSHQRLVYDIFHTTWLDFYHWEQGDYHRTLEALRSPIIINKPAASILLPQWIRPRAGLVRENQDTPGVRESSLLQTEAVVSSDEIEITEYQITDGITTRLQTDFAFTSVALRMVQETFPSPQYEACTPLDDNIYLGDDPEHMQFVPFADDPSFDWRCHSDEYETLSWQNMIRDPSLEAIITTTWNSCIHHGLTPKIVTKVLDRMLPAALEALKPKRDFCTWNHPLLNPIKPSNTALGSTIMTLDFCRLCELAYCCSRHEISPPVRSFVPNTLGRKLGFCSESCFLNSPTTDVAIMTWTEEKEKQIADLLTFLPDTTPCYLAKICRKPCMEVFSYRERLLPDHPTKRSEIQPSKKLKFSDDDPASENFVPWNASTIFTDLHEDKWEPVSPCSHEGPCTEQSNCPCDKSGARCTSKCLCDQKCPRRWNGCRCIKVARCSSTKCPCFRKKRECDPRVCKQSQSTATHSNKCGNVRMQMGQAKGTSVRQSQWGFGLFMEESVQKDELIGEYVGEVILTPTSTTRHDLATHRGRNYLFALNEHYSIDSTYAGNATRYINHSDIPNCVVKILLVDGLQRIGVMANRRIEAGEELFLDYGREFFIYDRTPGASTPDPLSLNEDDENDWPMEDIENMADTTWRFAMNDDSSDETYKENESGSGSGSS